MRILHFSLCKFSFLEKEKFEKKIQLNSRQRKEHLDFLVVMEQERKIEKEKRRQRKKENGRVKLTPCSSTDMH